MAVEDPDALTSSTPAPEPERPDQDDDAPASVEPEPSPGEGEGEDDAEEPKSLADAIQAVIDEGDDADEDADEPDAATAAPDKPDKPDPAQPEAPPDDLSADLDDDPSDEELKGLHPRSRRRVAKLLGQRNAARRELAEGNTRWEADKSAAQNYRDVVGFMQQHHLEPAEVQELFDIGRKLKSNDPRMMGEALNILMPLTMGLMELTGRTIPLDLRQKVEEGDISEDLARQLAQERANARVAAAQAQRATTTTQAVTQQVATRQYADGIRAAVSVWESKTRAADPDWNLKAASLSDAAHGLMAQFGAPQTPEQAVQLAQASYDRVNQTFKALRPAPQATRRTATSSQTANRAGHTPAPKTLAEAINAALRPA